MMTTTKKEAGDWITGVYVLSFILVGISFSKKKIGGGFKPKME